MKGTKIIGTLGPASESKKVLKAMVGAGLDVIRLNASHYKDGESIRKSIHLVRSVSKELGVEIGLFLDLQGPKIRVGEFLNDKALLENGSCFSITSDPSVKGTHEKVSTTYKGLVEDVRIGDPLYIDDGNIRLEVLEKKTKEVVCKVIRGGIISNNKGINLPLTPSIRSVLTEKDKRDLKVAVEEDLEYVAMSFVSKAEDIKELKEAIESFGGCKYMGVIAKIERRSAVDHIVEIIEASDAVMVARGDLGVEIGVERVPEIQKKILQEASKYIKPAIVATQMLESMIHKKTATRAEVSDVANAIYDRCDAVMLSGETAVGVDPENVVAVMSDICVATDKHLKELKRLQYSQIKRVFKHESVAASFCKAADQIAEENHADVMLAFTSSGNTPLIASKLNPSMPIIAPTDHIKVLRKMALYRGVSPLMLITPFKVMSQWGHMINIAVKQSLDTGLMKKPNKVIVTAGIPIGRPGGTNSIRMIDVN